MRKGFTLIELVVSMAIASILLSFECAIFVKCIGYYNKNIIAIRDASYCKEAMLIVNHIMNSNPKEISLKDNGIYVKESDGSIKIIKENPISSKLVVDYYDVYGNFKTTNIVSNNIKNMETFQKGNFICVNLIDSEGKSIRKCFGIKKVY
ncbi:MAG: type II secretion system protein [Clostridium sp.]|nr:type II secretion system protein [Clostridium sp.]